MFALAIVSPIFILIPYLGNVNAALTISQRMDLNPIASLYFETKSVFFCMLVLLGGGVHAAIQLLTSKMFGIS